MYASTEVRPSNLGMRIVWALLRVLWLAIRLPLLWVLVILEPVVRLVLSTVALLVTLTAVFFELTSTRPFPFLAVLAVGLAAYALLALYEGLIQLLQFRGGGRD